MDTKMKVIMQFNGLPEDIKTIPVKKTFRNPNPKVILYDTLKHEHVVVTGTDLRGLILKYHDFEYYVYRNGLSKLIHDYDPLGRFL